MLITDHICYNPKHLYKKVCFRHTISQYRIPALPNTSYRVFLYF